MLKGREFAWKILLAFFLFMLHWSSEIFYFSCEKDHFVSSNLDSSYNFLQNHEAHFFSQARSMLPCQLFTQIKLFVLEINFQKGKKKAVEKQPILCFEYEAMFLGLTAKKGIRLNTLFISCVRSPLSLGSMLASLGVKAGVDGNGKRKVCWCVCALSTFQRDVPRWMKTLA